MSTMKLSYLAVLLFQLLCCVWSKKEDSCATNFFEMEQSLLQNSDNRFNLLKTFYPPREAHPVMVKVIYSFTGGEEEVGMSDEGEVATSDQVWFWSESEFYLIQPLEVFQCTSLLFSNLVYRRRELSLQLHANCSSATDEYLKLLTTRMKLYAQSATTGSFSSTLRISDDYIAVAASKDEVLSDSLQSNFVKVWLHFTLAIFPLGTLLILYLCDPIQLLLGDNTWFTLEDEHIHGTVAALIQICILITIYIFMLDLTGFYFTVTSDFISFESNSAFYLSTITGVLIDLVAFVWVLFVLASSIFYVIKEFVQERRRVKGLPTIQSFNLIKKLLMSIAVAALLCLVNHIHFIILAFISDPFHAGSMAIMFIIFFLVFFFILRQFYNQVVLNSSKRPKVVYSRKLCPECTAQVEQQCATTGRELRQSLSESEAAYLRSKKPKNDDCDCFISGPGSHTPFSVRVVLLSFVGVCPFIILYLGTATLLFFTLPISKSIEDSPSRLYSLYQGTGLIIVGLLTYSILLRPDSFSITKVMERIAKRLRLPDHTNYWNKLTDEEKCAKVISTLMETHLKTKLYSTVWSDEDDSDEDGDDENGNVTQKTNSGGVESVGGSGRGLKRIGTEDSVHLMTVESNI